MYKTFGCNNNSNSNSINNHNNNNNYYNSYFYNSYYYNKINKLSCFRDKNVGPGSGVQKLNKNIPEGAGPRTFRAIFLINARKMLRKFCRSCEAKSFNNVEINKNIGPGSREQKLKKNIAKGGNFLANWLYVLHYYSQKIKYFGVQNVLNT